MGVLRGKRIFVVEDDVTNMAIIVMLLKQEGALVIQDPWSTATLDLLKNHLPIDMILLDLMLRWSRSGYDVFESIKTDPELMNIPIVAVSASDPAIEIPKTKVHGFAGFISKPIRLNTFASMVMQCLTDQPVWDTR